MPEINKAFHDVMKTLHDIQEKSTPEVAALTPPRKGRTSYTGQGGGNGRDFKHSRKFETKELQF